MPNEKKKYDSTVARMAGNIMPAILTRHLVGDIDEKFLRQLVGEAVHIARLIVAEVEHTEPNVQPQA